MKLHECKSKGCQSLRRHFDSTGQYSTGAFFCGLVRDKKLSEVDECPKEREREGAVSGQ